MLIIEPIYCKYPADPIWWVFKRLKEKNMTINEDLHSFLNPVNVETTVKIDTEELTIEYDDTLSIRNKVYHKVMEFFIKHESFNGESIMQCDEPQMDAAKFFADIADNIMKFKVSCKE